jgi:hypothetical protein
MAMNSASLSRDGVAADREIPLDRLLGQEVRAQNGVRVGRIEEFRARRQGTGLIVESVVIGAAGVLERMNVWARLLFGGKTSGYVVSWEQLDITDPRRPRLTCSVDDLEPL